MDISYGLLGELFIRSISLWWVIIPGMFIEWGAEAWRWRRVPVQAALWNPGTWGGYVWREEGAPNAVDFIPPGTPEIVFAPA